MKEDTIKSLNIEAGLCKTDKESEQSTADVTIHAVNDPNTKDVAERTKCNFQCKEGYFDKDKGDKKILFECVPNSDKKKPTGLKKPAPTGCKGAASTMPVNATGEFGADGVSAGRDIVVRISTVVFTICTSRL